MEMEGIMLFSSIIFIVFGILQIILFFKMWGMTNDVNRLVNHFCKEDKSRESVYTDSLGNTPSNSNYANVRDQGDLVTFEDGLSGKIRKQFGMWNISTRDKVFENKEDAIQALREDVMKLQEGQKIK